MKVATNSASWLYYGSLVLGRERQHCSLNTITCEPRPFSIRFKKFNSHLPVCLQGNPAHRPDMRVLNMESAAMVVVLSAKKHIVVDATLLDKESILTALNVKGMYGDDLEAKIRSIGGGKYFLSGISRSQINVD